MRQEISHDSLYLFEDEEDVELIPPNCTVPYGEICLFEETGEVVLFSKRTYKVSISAGLMANQIHHVNCALKIGTGPSFIREDFVIAELLKTVQVNT